MQEVDAQEYLIPTEIELRNLKPNNLVMNGLGCCDFEVMQLLGKLVKSKKMQNFVKNNDASMCLFSWIL